MRLKIKVHSKPTTDLAKTLGTTPIDVVSWMEDFISEELVDLFSFEERYYELNEILDLDMMSQLADMLIGHFCSKCNKETVMLLLNTIKL